MKRSHKRRYRLCLEQLEDRLAPAAGTFDWNGPANTPTSWESASWATTADHIWPVAGDTVNFDSSKSNGDCVISGATESCANLNLKNGYAGTLHLQASGVKNAVLNVSANFDLNSANATISLERGAETGSVSLKAQSLSWEAGSFKGDNYAKDTVEATAFMYVAPSGPWVITDHGTDASGGLTVKIDSGANLLMDNSTSLVINSDNGGNDIGTTQFDIAGKMEFVHTDTVDGIGGISVGFGNVGTSWVNVEGSGSVIADAGLSNSPTCGIPCYSAGTITVHCSKDANNKATGGLFFAGQNTHTNNYSLYIQGGTVTLDNDPTLSGQALWASFGLYMNGGTFNAAPAGGTAYIQKSAFTLNGGTLNVGASDGSSYGILSITSSFTLSGGTINLWISGDGSFWDRILATGAGLITGGTLSLTLNGAYQSWMQPANRVLLSAQGGWGSTNWTALSFSCGTGNIHWGHNATTVYAYPNPP
jgi:hypothetical protein